MKILKIIIGVFLAYYFLVIVFLLINPDTSPINKLQQRYVIFHEQYQRQKICYECVQGIRNGICPKIANGYNFMRYPNATAYAGEYESKFINTRSLIYQKVEYQTRPVVINSDALIKIEEAGELDNLIISSTECESDINPDVDDRYSKESLSDFRKDAFINLFRLPFILPAFLFFRGM